MAGAATTIFQAAEEKGEESLEDPLPFSLHIILQNFQTQQQECLNEVQPIDHAWPKTGSISKEAVDEYFHKLAEYWPKDFSLREA